VRSSEKKRGRGRERQRDRGRGADDEVLGIEIESTKERSF